MSLKVRSCLICDDFRAEVSGKATVIGFGGVLPISRLLMSGPQTMINQLTFVFILDAGAVSSEVNMEIIAPNGSRFTKSPNAGPVQNGPTTTMNLAVGMRNVHFSLAGIYKINLLSESELVFESTVGIEFGILEQVRGSKQNPT